MNFCLCHRKLLYTCYNNTFFSHGRTVISPLKRLTVDMLELYSHALYRTSRIRVHQSPTSGWFTAAFSHFAHIDTEIFKVQRLK